jgi:hypothetical protein
MREFADSQDKFNQLYADYQHAVNRLSEGHGLLDALNIIDKIAGVVGGACRLGDLLSTSSSKPASPTGSPSIRTDDYRSSTNMMIDSVIQFLQRQAPLVNRQGEVLRGIEVKIQTYYSNHGIQPPATDLGEPPHVTIPLP